MLVFPCYEKNAAAQNKKLYKYMYEDSSFSSHQSKPFAHLKQRNRTSFTQDQLQKSSRQPRQDVIFL